jgi:hypothetical protein
MPVTAILKKRLKKRKIWLAVIGITLAVSLIPYDTYGRAVYIPLGAVLLMFAQEVLRMNLNPWGCFLVLGTVATLIIERLIGPKSTRPPRWKPKTEFFDNET